MEGDRYSAPAGRRLLWTALCGLLAVIGVGSGVASVVASANGQPLWVLTLPLYAALAYFAGRATVRIPSCGVQVGSTTVEIDNPLRSWQVPIEQADHFAAEVRRGNNGQPGVTLYRRGARPIGVWALNRDGFIWQMRRLADQQQATADALNQALAPRK